MNRLQKIIANKQNILSMQGMCEISGVFFYLN